MENNYNNYNDPRSTQPLNRGSFTAPTLGEQGPGYQREVSFGDAIKMGFQNYAKFSGRSSRSEFWWWALFSFLLQGAAYGIDQSGSLSGLISLALLLPGLGLSCRRLHDIGRGAGWIFINLIPFVGMIIFIIWAANPSEPMPNRFGPVPNVR